MKKVLAFVIAASILLFINGCTNSLQQTVDKPVASISNTISSASAQQSVEQPVASIGTAASSASAQQSVEQPVASIGAAASSASGSKPWPTKLWSTSTPETQGLSSSELAKSDAYIKDQFPNVYSMLVVRHGYLVYEKYYSGMDQKTPVPVYSVTKSVMSALTGIALHQKLLKSVDQTVYELLPEYFAYVDDAGKKKITLKNVLTMTGGLESIDNNYSEFFTSPDWLSCTLDKPLTDKPGTKFVYNTGLAQFLPNIIAKASGMDTKEYAEKYLFSEVGMNCEQWNCDHSGHYGGGTGLYLTPRDMAKFGYLYLNNGNWNGKQIIQKDWVAESTKKQTDTDDERDYGYLFWMQTVHDSTRNVDYFTYHADGAGGQKIIILPQLDIVAVVTADDNTATKEQNETEKIIFNYVLPAVN